MKPNLRVPLNKLLENIGTEDNPKTLLTEAVDFYISNATYLDKDYEPNFAAAEGMLIEDDFNYILKKHGDDQPDRKVPARLFNYGIIIPTLVNTILGEFRKRDKTAHIVSRSPESFNRKKIAKLKFAKERLKMVFLNTLKEEGFPVDTPMFEVDFPRDIAQFEEEWADTHIEANNTIYNILKDSLDLEEKFSEGLYHFLCTNSVFTYKYIYDNREIYEILHPNEIGFYASRNIKYLEEGEAQIRKQKMTTSECLSNFGDLLDEKQMKRLEDRVSSNKMKNMMILHGNPTAKTHSMTDSPYGSLGKIQIGKPLGETTLSTGETEHDVYHIVFKGWLEMGDLEEIDPDTGELVEFLVTRDYHDHSQVRNWSYKPFLFECTKVDDMYLQVMPLSKQRRKKSDPFSVKSCYNGFLGRGQSFVEGLMPFEHNINFALYKGMMTLGRSKGKLTFLPLSIIPERDDLDMFDFLHFLETEGIGFIEDVDDSVLRALQYIKSIDLSFDDYLKFLMDYVDRIMMMAMRKAGFSPERIGDTSPSKGKAISEMSFDNSATSTEDFMLRYMKFLEKEGQGLIDYGQHAWKDGKRGMYMKGERQVYYDLEPDMLREEMGFFFKFDPRESEKLRQMKQLAFVFAQNQASPSTIADIIGSDNVGQMRTLMRKQDDLEQQLKEAQSKREEAMNIIEQNKAQLEAQMKDKDIMSRYQASINADQTKERIADKQIYAKMLEQLKPDGSVQNPTELGKLFNDRMKMLLDNQVKQEGNQVKRETNEKDLKVAKINQETQLKNKVAGEK